MTLRNLLTLISMAVLIGATACSTSSEAESDEQAEQAEQTQTQQEQEQQEQGLEQAEADEPAQTDQAADKQQMMAQMCPMQVEGTTRQLVKLDDAVAVDFTTTGDVDELRRRVLKMAQMHEKMHGDGGQMEHGQMHGQMHGEQGQMEHGQMEHGQMHGQMHGEQMTEEQRQMHGQMMQMMSDVTVETEEIESGMRMKFTPKDPAQTDKLYQMMEKHSQMMDEKGQCPMMQMMDDGSKEQEPQEE